MAEQVVGIDLGTTYSLVAAVRDGQPVVLDYRGEKLLPSVVGLAPSGDLLVGTPARNQFVVAPDRTIKSIKRQMGSPEPVPFGPHRYTPPEISAFILRELKRRAEAALGEVVRRAVITVPARFSDAQRQATRDAGEIAGFEVARIINEPTAAALAYGLQRSGSLRALVYDLGGGTFDVSAVELADGIVEVRASHGNPHLGGDDFDALLAVRLAEIVERERRRQPRDDQRAAARLTQAAERAKIVLSDAPYATVREEHLLPGIHLETEVAREDFEALIQELVDQTLAAVDRALADAGWRPKDLDEVLLVGGSTRIPLVARRVARHLDLTPRAEVHPDEAVALGAAVQGAIIAGEPIDAVLVDICPYSLGIRTADWSDRLGTLDQQRFSIVIPRNTTIPCSKTESFYTLFPDQESVQIDVFQGESRRADQNTPLGEFLFDRIAPNPDGGPREVLVSFDYDIDGIVHVAARDRRSGRQEGIKVTAPVTQLSAAQKSQARAAIEAAPPAESDVVAALRRRSTTIRERLAPAGTAAAAALAELDTLLVALGEAPAGEAYDAAVGRLTEWIYEYEDDS